MLFNSAEFLAFFPIVIIIYFLLPRRFRRYFLLAASCHFYMSFIPKYMFILGFTTVVDYTGALLVERFAKRPKLKKASFITAICLNIGLLVIFKYLGMVGDFINFFGKRLSLGNISVPDLILPIGISFHTFQSMGYLIDVYLGRLPAERDFFQFALFLMYFPQLVAGPIERGANLFAQLKKEHRLKAENFAIGAPMMLWGMFKKVVVADNLSMVADLVFGNVEMFGGLMYVAAVLCFAFQIYCDFSGYSDIAIGAAKIMDIDLMKNFDTPYFSLSPSEFWRRWHISLSTWFRDYIYIPLGGNRVSFPRWCLNQLVTFGISGIWHGADLTFVAWGLLNGLYIIAARMLQPVKEFLKKMTHIDKVPLLPAVLSSAATFAFINFSWIFFRADSFSEAFYIIANMFGKTYGDMLGISEFRLYICKIVPFVLILIEMCMKIPKVVEFYKRSKALRVALYTICLSSIILFGAYDTQAFIYFQF